MRWQAQQLVSQFGGELRGDAGHVVSRIATLANADSESLSFLANAKYRLQLETTRAGVVIVREIDLSHVPRGTTAIVTDNPYFFYAQVSTLFALEPPSDGIDSSAKIHPTAKIGKSVHIGAQVVVGPGVLVHDSAVLHPGVVLQQGVQIGARTVLHPRVVVYHDCEIGQDCILHSGVVIGSDGFGFAPHHGQWKKIQQLGRVVIGDQVEIGANTTIDRGAIDDTVIERGCKLDNQIQIAHNVRIGENTVMAACVGVAGSAVIGKGCMIGGSAGILGHLEIADGTTVSAMSLVTRSLTDPGMYTGVFPLMSNRDWERSAVLVRQLESRMAQIKERLSKLESRDESQISKENNHE